MTQTSQYAIPHGSKVLVTGANGYIASHIINVLLELGYFVRGTVRTSMPWLQDYFEKEWGPDRCEFVQVPDFQKVDAFDSCVQGISGIIHVVSSSSPSQETTIDICNKAQALPSGSGVEDIDAAVAYTVNGSVNILRAAATQDSIKRVVFTSSIVAAGYPTGPGFKLDVGQYYDSAKRC